MRKPVSLSSWVMNFIRGGKTEYDRLIILVHFYYKATKMQYKVVSIVWVDVDIYLHWLDSIGIFLQGQ